MFSIPGILGLLFLTFIRPQAFIVELANVPLVHVVYLMTLIGFALDLRLRIIQPRATPLLGWALAYLGWCAVTDVVRAPQVLGPALAMLSICFALFFVTAHGVQSFRGFRTMTVQLILIALFLAGAGIYQGLAPQGCIEYRGSPHGVFDGRPCDTVFDCHQDAEPGAAYMCEHIGLAGTNSVAGRVRWLGIIQDPNELAMCVVICIPLLIGLWLLRPTTGRGLFYFVCGLTIAWCLVYTKSRGGQLVFLTTIGIYFVRRFGIRGLLLCAMIAAPILLLGGRSGDEAEQSKMERIEALYIAMTLTSAYPLTGCGYMQFTQHHEITAHNSYALAAAELGLPGLFLFLMLFYVSMKTFVLATRRYLPQGPAGVAYVWAGALLAAQSGLMIGIFFLSFNTSGILWTFFGVCGCYYLAVRRHDPSFEVKIGLPDLLAVGVLTSGLFGFMYVYSRYKMNGH